MGYIRATGFPFSKPFLNFNYLGFGTFILPGTRTSIYPLSFGSWHSPPSRQYFLGWRLNAGVRILEPYQEDNNTNQSRSRPEFSLPIDFGITIYNPLSFYVRIEGLTYVPNGDNGKDTIESLFIGRGSLTAGVTYDLAGIL